MTTLNPTLNFDAREPRVVANPDASALFPAAPIYARTPKKKTTNSLPLLVGAPVVLVAAGAMAWMMMASPGQTPAATEQPAQMAVTDTAPLTPALAPEAATPDPVPAPYEAAAVEAAAPRVATPAPVRAAPRAVVARRAAPVATTPDASSASSNVSATVAEPTPAAPAAIVPEPAPLVIPAPTASPPTPPVVTPVVPQ
ncbi:MAG: hypothetical protein B7Z44_19360 [Caulobacter sp. 12-67-6]|nr:MAG: hypothetical protein B7Z44_19360 [Caulobacter sp. 12-67-6]OYX72800.1 MAG: hypothetical protein B7Y81_05245 [Caulobacter sp. 32-67-35]